VRVPRRSKRAAPLIATFVAATLAVSGCATSSSERASSSTTTSGTTQPVALDVFLHAFAKRTSARVKVTYTATADRTTYALIVSRDRDRWAHFESANGGWFTVGSWTAERMNVKVTQCQHVQTAPACQDGILEESLPEDYVSLVAEDEIDRAAQVHAIDSITNRVIAGRRSWCIAVDGPEVTRRMADGSKTDSGTVCIDSRTGMILSWQTPGTAAVAGESILATKVEQPMSSDFRPPVPASQVTI
jgi:hypothetical protein